MNEHIPIVISFSSNSNSAAFSLGICWLSLSSSLESPLFSSSFGNSSIKPHAANSVI